MDSTSAKKLAMSLLAADSEVEVIKILTDAGLWDDPAAWRLYGDRDSNYATIGNQQSRPEAALVEKLVNCVDTRLLNECLERGIDPESDQAPQSVRAAIARFYEGRELRGEIGGRLEEWERKEIQEQEEFITLAVTGSKPPKAMPCVTVVDNGEGQTPARMPDTFLSIDRGNKLRIPFVQGKFNMGGTGALKFCGTNSLQLIMSRRNPKILKKWKGDTRWGSTDALADEWSFTVVRRERPTGAVGQVRNSVFRYLAPVHSSGKKFGDLLSFKAESVLAMPEGNKPYARPMTHGSVIKLYEYDMKGFASNALFPDGLLGRLEILLPQIALPVRMHECRDYKGDPNRSFANTLVGVAKRLRDNKNLEEGYPCSASLTVRHERMTAQIYAFKDDKAESYRNSEGIIFTINGQTHGAIPKTFFERSRVKMQRLAKSLLVTVDCSALSVGAREDLFMNSRDRLSNGELRKAVEQELEELIGKHPGLRDLREKRRSQEIDKRLENSKPLENVLQSIMKSSPTLSRLFLLGQRLNQPRRGNGAGSEDGGGSGGSEKVGKFEGKTHPTFFRFHNKKDNEILDRAAELGRRCRIRFDTDVENGYFERTNLPGRYNVQVVEGPLEGLELDHSLTLYQGIANWSVDLPEDRLSVGDEITLECSVADDTLLEPFASVARIKVLQKQNGGGGYGSRKMRGGGDATESGGVGSSGKDGKAPTDGSDNPAGIAMPHIEEVKEGDENWVRYGFDSMTACKVIDDGEDETQSKLSFYVGVDNASLRTEMKDGKEDAALTKKKFVWGNVLVGLALIHDHRTKKRSSSTEGNGDDEESKLHDAIDSTTRALAPFLIPMIDYLGEVSLDDAATGGVRGEDD